MHREPDVAVALDGMGLDDATILVDRLGPECRWVKVGLELYTRAGPAAVKRFTDRDKRVFLDLKLHDIPNTVASAVRAAADHGADLLTIHASGGATMVGAAREATQESGMSLRILAVTVLTSMDENGLAAAWGLGHTPSIADEVVRLAEQATEAGAHGLVCSVLEAGLLRTRLGSDPLLVTPGIRLAGDATNDQARVATPAQAARAGADLLVVGRTITQAADPSTTFARVMEQVRGVGAAS